MNICGVVNTPCVPDDKVAVCQLTNIYAFFNCGLLSTQTIVANPDVPAGKGVAVKYSGGDQCSGGPERSTTVKFTCSEADDPGYIYEYSEDDCAYVILGYSAAACGKDVSGGIGAGGIILIM